MNLGLRQDPDQLTLTPGIKFTASDGSEEVSRAVQEALDQGVRRILFDLSAVQLIDSLGVGQLMASYVSTTNRGGRMVLCRLSPRVALVLKTASLHLVLDIRDSAPEDVAWT